MSRERASVKVSPEEVLPVFGEIFNRRQIQAWLQVEPWAAGQKRALYWRLLTPLIVLWCVVVQRLLADHSCDGVVSHLHTGAADGLDPVDRHEQPLSQRLQSENTSAYVQARERLPLGLVKRANQQVWQMVCQWLASAPQSSAWQWQGHAVRLLDGTTFRLPSTPSLVKEYGQAKNGKGASDWVVVRSVSSFCLYTHCNVGCSTANLHTSESAMLDELMRTDATATIYVGDINFGVYRTVQTACAHHQLVLLRLDPKRAQALRRKNHYPTPLCSGQECSVTWLPGTRIQVDPTLPVLPLAGRLLYLRLNTPGFRPLELYFFTTLLDPQRYPFAALCQLYGLRWQVELDYRHLKTTLDIEQFSAQSPAIFRLELFASLLAYNLVRATMVKAALFANLPLIQLSFVHAWRRLRDALFTGIPAWILQQDNPYQHLLAHIAKGRLIHQPNKTRHEPHMIREWPRVYPPLHGDRNAARRKNLILLGSLSSTLDSLNLQTLTDDAFLPSLPNS